MSGVSTAEAVGAQGQAAGGPLARGGSHPVATLVVGLGNPILGDDGVGWRVADAVERACAGRSRVTVERLAVGGLTLMEHLVGVGRAVLVDAVVTGGDPIGTVRVTTVADLPSRARDHLDSPHDVTLSGALDIGRALGASLPEVVSVVTVEVVAVDQFSEALSPVVERAVPIAVDHVLDLIGAA